MEMISSILVGIFLGILSLEDIRYQKLRRVHFAYMIPISVILGCYNLWFKKVDSLEVMAALLVVLVIAIVGKVSRGIGGGDIAVLFMLSFMCGIKKLLVGIGVSLGIVYIAAIVMLCRKKLNKKSTFPYIPFLSIGMICAML